jgi:hypothetical protein
MASIKHYANGLGGTTGSDIAVGGDVQVSGKVYYLGNSVAGNSDANTGLERNKPLATFSAANALLAANDTLDILAGHVESIASSITISDAGVRIVGEGTGSSVPRFTCSGAVVMWDVTGECVHMDNLSFAASTAVPTAVIRISANAFDGVNLSFSCGANDTNRAMSFAVAAGNPVCSLRGCTFTAVAAQPAVGFEVLNNTTSLVMEDCTFDGGSFGWSGYAFKGSVAVFGMNVIGLQLLNGSDVLLPTTSNGYIQTVAVTGDSRIDWTA